MNNLNNDKITAPKVPFRGFRGRLSTILLALGLLISPVFGQQFSDTQEKKPFESPVLFSGNDQLNRAPGGGIIPPPTEDDKVGAPVKDVIWLLPLLAICYGIFRRKESKN